LGLGAKVPNLKPKTILAATPKTKTLTINTMFKISFHNHQSGFTLFELLVYVAIVSVVIVSAVYFTIDIINASQKSRAFQEVQQNARLAMSRMLQAVQEADDVNTGQSNFDSNPGLLSLAMDDSARNPTIFRVASNALQISQGTGDFIDLTSDKVIVTNLVFTNLSVIDRTKNIKITITVEHINPDNTKAFEASVTLQSAAVIRERAD